MHSCNAFVVRNVGTFRDLLILRDSSGGFFVAGVQRNDYSGWHLTGESNRGISKRFCTSRYSGFYDNKY